MDPTISLAIQCKDCGASLGGTIYISTIDGVVVSVPPCSCTSNEYDKGYADGEREANIIGYQNGYDTGHNHGYQKGYSDGC